MDEAYLVSLLKYIREALRQAVSKKDWKEVEKAIERITMEIGS